MGQVLHGSATTTEAVRRAIQYSQESLKMIAAAFLRHLIAAVSYAIHIVLTDNGIQFKNREQDRTAMEHIFGRTCRDNGIEHRTTKIKHPWTNGQVERMNRSALPLVLGV